MAKRLTKIYTRTGDDGTTGLADGSRTHKDAARLEAIGDVDELNSTMGVLLTQELPEAMRLVFVGVAPGVYDLVKSSA